MRIALLLTAIALVSCAAPEHDPALFDADGSPIVGRVMFKDRTVNLTRQTIDATGGDPILHELRVERIEAIEVWADIDPALR